MQQKAFLFCLNLLLAVLSELLLLVNLTLGLCPSVLYKRFFEKEEMYFALAILVKCTVEPCGEVAVSDSP